jgi:serine/threonine protein kinase
MLFSHLAGAPNAPCLPTLQLDNMLLHGPWPRPQLKLCDFGFSKNEVVQSVSKSTCGTPEYMAPEVGTLLMLPPSRLRVAFPCVSGSADSMCAVCLPACAYVSQ